MTTDVTLEVKSFLAASSVIPKPCPNHGTLDFLSVPTTSQLGYLLSDLFNACAHGLHSQLLYTASTTQMKLDLPCSIWLQLSLQFLLAGMQSNIFCTWKDFNALTTSLCFSAAGIESAGVVCLGSVPGCPTEDQCTWAWLMRTMLRLKPFTKAFTQPQKRSRDHRFEY